jgi:3-oxoacyl-(acyl-carrier-protein) synthase
MPVALAGRRIRVNVAIAQSHVATAFGWGVDALWNGLLSGETAIRPTRKFAERGFISDQAALLPDLHVPDGQSRAGAALERILSPLIGKVDADTALIVASTVGEIEFVEQAVLNNRPELAAESRPQNLVRRVQRLLNLRGPAMAISSACASSAAAMTRGASILRHGQARQVLIVACDAVSEFVYSGFSGLASLCAGPARPFDANRCGLTLGEAAGWMLLADTNAADATRILGWGNTTDAVHMTAPDRNGLGLSRAVNKAIAMAGCKSADVGFIAAHGTGTQYSDAMEMTAFRRAVSSPRPVFSVKGAVGHTMAAAGLVQILVAGLALRRGIVPPTIGCVAPDAPAADWLRGANSNATIALSTNSGFGGVNTAILLGGGKS